MSTKEWIYLKEKPDIGCYQEITFDDENNNPAVVYVQSPEEFSVEKNEFGELVQVSVPSEIFDEIAIAWCKRRKLQGALGGPVGKEFGSPDCDYD